VRWPVETETTISLFKDNPGFKDFRNYLAYVWKALKHPAPTPVQNEMAWFLQHGPTHLVIEGFRGVAKTWITATYVTWTLGWDQTKNILIVSASKGFADNVSTFITGQIEEAVPGLKELTSNGRSRHGKSLFDVRLAPASKDASVSSVGITSQLNGYRADLIIPDDVETSNNSLTPGGRELVELQSREFGAILKPGGRTVYLGTPQTEQSLYNTLVDKRHYEVVVWPVMYPTPKQRAALGGRLAPSLAKALDEGRALPGEPTDPTRFGPLVIEEKRALYGPTGFALQYMLDTSLADVGRYPLRLSSLILLDFPDEVGPERIIYSNAPGSERRDVPCYGLNGDRFFGGVLPDKCLWVPWQGSAMYVDPSGTGKDETAYCVSKQLNGQVYIPECVGLEGGYSDAVMSVIAGAALRNKVNRIVVEANFGDGMFEKLLLPHVQKLGYPVAIESVKVTKQKELRILDVLEPAMAQRRIVVAPDVFLRDDYLSPGRSTETAHHYLLAHQITRLTRERGCLQHDDRVDALAGAVGLWTDSMAKDVDRASKATRDRHFDEAIEGFLERATRNQRRPKTFVTPRGTPRPS